MLVSVLAVRVRFRARVCGAVGEAAVSVPGPPRGTPWAPQQRPGRGTPLPRRARSVKNPRHVRFGGAVAGAPRRRGRLGDPERERERERGGEREGERERGREREKEGERETRKRRRGARLASTAPLGGLPAADSRVRARAIGSLRVRAGFSRGAGRPCWLSRGRGRRLYILNRIDCIQSKYPAGRRRGPAPSRPVGVSVERRPVGSCGCRRRHESQRPHEPIALMMMMIIIINK